MNFKEELERLRKYVDIELEKVMPTEKGFQSEVFEAMTYSVLGGGKRIRPILAVKACELVGGKREDVVPFAMALELIHTYSLIHDDLPAMDNDDFRRGKPTNHKIYGESMAILAGDGLLNLAYEHMLQAMLQYPERHKSYLKAVNEIAQAVGIHGMIGGQVVDILSEDKEITEAELVYIHKNKTSALIEASIVSGALIGGAGSAELSFLKEYGRAIGLCFQIRDDILDKIGDTDELGKNIGSDEENNKVTYLTFYGLEESIQKTEVLYKKAINAISEFPPHKRVFFEELARYLVYREH